MTSIHRRLAFIVFGLWLSSSSVRADEMDASFDFRDSKFDEKILPYAGKDAEKYVTPEKEGLRIRFAPPDVAKEAMGIWWRTHVHGDFVATMHYEILKNSTPTQGYGVGVELYLMLNNPPRKQADGLAFARLIYPKAGLVTMYSHRANNEQEKRISVPGTSFNKPTTAATDKGQLRMARVKGTLIGSIAEEGGEFVELFRDEVGTENIRLVRMAGLPGGDPNATLDMRIIDCQLKGELPGLAGLNFPKTPQPAAKAGEVVAPAEAPVQEAPRPTRWFLIAAVLVMLVLGVAFVGIILLLWLRKATAQPAKR